MNRRFEGTTSHNYRSFETAGTSIFDSQVESSCIFLLLLDIVFANIIKRGSDNKIKNKKDKHQCEYMPRSAAPEFREEAHPRETKLRRGRAKTIAST